MIISRPMTGQSPRVTPDNPDAPTMAVGSVKSIIPVRATASATPAQRKLFRRPIRSHTSPSGMMTRACTPAAVASASLTKAGLNPSFKR